MSVLFASELFTKLSNRNQFMLYMLINQFIMPYQFLAASISYIVMAKEK